MVDSGAFFAAHHCQPLFKPPPVSSSTARSKSVERCTAKQDMGEEMPPSEAPAESNSASDQERTQAGGQSHLLRINYKITVC